MLCQKSKVLVIIQKLTLMKTSADSLKKSADALNDSSLWEKKKIKKKDEKTGEEIEVEDYDWDKITKAVKSFVEDYNDVVKEAGKSNTKIKQLNDINWIEIGYKEGDTFSVYGKEYAIDSSGHINVSAEDEFTSTEIKYPSRSI